MAGSEVKYSKHFLNKLEDLFSESDYVLRYEKGNFKSGYCILNDTKVAIINKYYPLEGKINCLMDIIKLVDMDIEMLSDKNKKFLLDILETPSAI